MDAKGLRELADNTFTKKLGLLSLQQEIAENFYPQRADFTMKRYLGDDFGANLMSSFPPLCAREFGNQIPAMLRPTQKPWFEQMVQYTNQVDLEGRQFLAWMTETQRRAMYDPHAMMNKALAQSDMDWAVFGQAVIQCGMNDRRDALLHQTWHLKDCAWLEDDEGNVCPIFRKWRRQARVLVKKFKKAAENQTIKKLADKTPFSEVNCLHIICDAELYDGDARGRPYWSILYDCDHNLELEAVPVWNKQYAIPRWQVVSGSQYSYSPAVVIALPEARLIQAMTYTLLEAGEKATNPPMVATEGAVRSDVAIYAGGTTWVDYEYDERLGDALRPLTQDIRGLPFGADQLRDSRAILKECFFLNKLKPFTPTQDPTMTAFQAGQIVAQYIRDALPLFEPMETEYNGQVCELDFDNLLRNGAFGSPLDFPRSIQGQSIQFRFQSPLHDAIEAQKGHKFLEMAQLIKEAMALDKNVAAIPDAMTALRDALDGIKTPPKWLRSEVKVQQMVEGQQEQDQSAVMMEQMLQGADAAKAGTEAMVNLKEAQAA